MLQGVYNLFCAQLCSSTFHFFWNVFVLLLITCFMSDSIQAFFMILCVCVCVAPNVSKEFVVCFICIDTLMIFMILWCVVALMQNVCNMFFMLFTLTLLVIVFWWLSCKTCKLQNIFCPYKPTWSVRKIQLKVLLVIKNLAMNYYVDARWQLMTNM
jgi:hypothetical protein